VSSSKGAGLASSRGWAGPREEAQPSYSYLRDTGSLTKRYRLPT